MDRSKVMIKVDGALVDVGKVVDAKADRLDNVRVRLYPHLNGDERYVDLGSWAVGAILRALGEPREEREDFE